MQENGKLWQSDARRQLLFKWVLSVSLLVQIASCPRLWFGPRSFPAIPVIGATFPQWISSLLSLALTVTILSIAIVPRPKLQVFALLFFAVYLVVLDITRLQPWFYQYLLLFACLPLRKQSNRFSCFAFVIASTYFWSGLQKANLNFATNVFPSLIHPLGLDGLSQFWIVVPIAEASLGVLLLFRRTRTLALIIAVLMHVFLLEALGPTGSNFNSVVWPWNISLLVIDFVLFFKNDEAVLPGLWRPALGKVVIGLVGICPALSFFNAWDDYLSASLYSGKPHQAFLLFSPRGYEMLPREIQPFVLKRPDRIGLEVVPWTLADLNVPPYPERRVYRQLASEIHNQGVPYDDMQLFVSDRPGLLEKEPAFKDVPFNRQH